MSKKELSGLPSDGRPKGDYKTKYLPEIVKKQQREAFYILFLMAVAFAAIILAFFNYNANSNAGWLGLQGDSLAVFTNMVYCAFAGLLGGATFDMKVLYRAIASEKWNEDRAFWRYLSPFVSIVLAFVMGAMFYDQIVSSSGFFAISLGFFSGYFSDEAVGKMYDVALVLFSRGSAEKKEDKEHEENANGIGRDNTDGE